MSVTPKDMVFGAAAATAFLGLVVYNQHKFNKLQSEIDRLKEETKTLAQYIKILESKVAGDFHSIISAHDAHHHHHHTHTGHPPAEPNPPVVKDPPSVAPAKPALEEAKPEPPIIPDQRKASIRQPVKAAATTRTMPPPRGNPPMARSGPTPPATRNVQPPKKKVVVEEISESSDPEEDNKNQSGSDEESSAEEPPVSNRRSTNQPVAKASPPQVKRMNPVPRAAGNIVKQTPKHVITVEEGKVPKDKEESYNPVEENNRKAVEISGGRPTPPKAGGPRTVGPKSGGAVKRFGPKTDESEDSDKHVNSNKVKGKSILKNPGNENNKIEKENSIDADLAEDMAMVASKSSKRAEDNEGREVGQTEAKARMAKTAQIAEAMRKKAEERSKGISESPGT